MKLVLSFCFLLLSVSFELYASYALPNSVSSDPTFQVLTSNPKFSLLGRNLTVSGDRASWNDANLECRKNGGILANMDTYEKLDHLRDAIIKYNVTGTWFWINSDLLTRKLIYLEPNYFTESTIFAQYNLEGCFMMQLTGYDTNMFQFLNTGCDEYITFLCQWR